MKIKYKCKFPKCKSSFYKNTLNAYKNKCFYKFPNASKKKLLSEWKQICNIEDDVRCDNFFVCEDHFVQADFMNISRRRLHSGVVPRRPTLYVNLPYMSFTGEESERNNDSFEGETPRRIKTETQKANSPDVILVSDEEVSVCPNFYENMSNGHIDICNSDKSISLPPTPVKNTLDKPRTPVERTLDFSDKNDKYKFLTFFPDTGNEESDNLRDNLRREMRIHRSITKKLDKLKDLLKTEFQKIRVLGDLCNTNKFKTIHANLGEINRDFIKQQLKSAGEKTLHRKWTVEEQVSALSIYVRGSRLYKYLTLHFQLPSIGFLKTLVSDIPFDTGLNLSTLKSLKTEAQRMHPGDKYCALLFKEMLLDVGLHYEPNKQRIRGYQDLGHLGRSPVLANNVLVFMIRGVRKPWKQVIAYYFIKDTVASDHLKILIIGLISQLQNIGFVIVSTVCDASSVNKQVLHDLCKENSEDANHFMVNDKPVVTIFDVPHLLRTTRDTLLSHKIQFGKQKEAKFKYVETLFNIDQNKKFKTLRKLKEDHFDFSSSHIRRKVSVAAAQMSMTVAAGIETLVLTKTLPSEALHTAEFIGFIDTLFDSLNGNSPSVVGDKKYRCVLSKTSPHMELWSDVLDDIKKWKIINLGTGMDKTDAFNFVDGWQITVRSFMNLWDRLKNVGFKQLNLRAFNLHPLKNLFSCIKELDLTKNKLTCFQFETFIKMCMVNNLSMPVNNPKCEDDECIPLSNLTSHLVAKAEDELYYTETEDSYLQERFFKAYRPVEAEFLEDADSPVLAEIAGNILKLVKIDTTCVTCTTNLFAHDTINKPGTSTPLHVSEDFLMYLQYIHEELYTFMTKHCYMNHLIDNFKTVFLGNESTTFCVEHLPELSILNEAVPFLMYKYVKDINQMKQKRQRTSTGRNVKQMKKSKSTQ